MIDMLCGQYWNRGIYHFPVKLLRILKQDTIGRVRAYGGYSDPFQIRNGVWQGCVITPTLFNLFLDAVMAKA